MGPDPVLDTATTTHVRSDDMNDISPEHRTARGAASAAPLLEMKNISKSFGGSHALDQVSISLRAGQVLALCGANGAGKSTLVKILAGLESADEGEIFVDGERAEISSPRDSAALRLSFVHQELNLVPKFTALQNMAMGSDEQGTWGVLTTRRVRRQAMEVQERLGYRVPLDTRVEDLSLSDRWMVSLGRSLMRSGRVVAMDEPTASFTDEEAQRLYGVIDELQRDGVGILYISHRLEEVLQVSDDVTVLRNGRFVTTVPASSTSRRVLTQHIVGREVADFTAAVADQETEPTEGRLSVQGLTRAPKVLDVSFDIGRGEIVGLAGLVGAGRTELARLIVGADAPQAGAMTMDGEPFAPSSPHEALVDGVALVPEERRSQGLVLADTVVANLNMAAIGAERRLLRPFRPRASTVSAQRMIERFGIKVRSEKQNVIDLSGGNQQKVVVGKYVVTGPKLLILDEPTVGVDVGARAEIYGLIRSLADEGMSVLVISSDFEEFAICDRVLVMRSGRLVDDVPAHLAHKDHLTSLCFGTSEQEQIA
ncbi:sugar ABC transporter ATP-binding protein [Aeromicrobium endophyticum]|uniref:Sugar ABC transporter ATP-binding protein n=2 Tax=Aeromicrobium endophyticum TaxID=2292704 RepID=A0A371PDN7_9ACTN|nr:sugar ABC transporter ATP-binding protein [Aeromicrobium endophyticum]